MSAQSRTIGADTTANARKKLINKSVCYYNHNTTVLHLSYSMALKFQIYRFHSNFPPFIQWKQSTFLPPPWYKSSNFFRFISRHESGVTCTKRTLPLTNTPKKERRPTCGNVLSWFALMTQNSTRCSFFRRWLDKVLRSTYGEQSTVRTRRIHPCWPTYLGRTTTMPR